MDARFTSAGAGDILAQSTLGVACLEGSEYIPKNVTKGVYWLRKVADRDRSEFDRVPRQMVSLLEKRQHEFDLRKRNVIEAKYLDLVAEKVAFEVAFLGLIEVYLGEHGATYRNTTLALSYMRRGAIYGLPSAQRMLGIVTRYGLFGVPQNEIASGVLLSEAAENGDRSAQQLLAYLRL